MNIQSDTLVIGIEGEISHGDIAGSTACTSVGFVCSGDIDTIASIRIRTGVALENYLFYSVSGVAYGHAFTDVDPIFPGYGFGTLGYVLGAGIEVGLTEQLPAVWNILI